MKRIMLTAFAAALALTAFTGCSKKKTAAGDQLAAVKAKGEIIFATEGTWAPWTYHNESDELTGFDVEVSKKIAEKLGVKATFVETEWDGIFAGIDAKRYDMTLNGVEITEEREQKYDFSTPYCYSPMALIVLDTNTDITKFEDLKGKTTANSLASTYAVTAEKYGAKVQTIDSFEETIKLLVQGRIDATLNDATSFYDYKKVHPETPIKIAKLNDSPSQIAIPFRKGNESAALREAVNKAIDELRTDGTLSALSARYFGFDASKK